MIIHGSNGIEIAEQHTLPKEVFDRIKKFVNHKVIPHNKFLVGFHEQAFDLSQFIPEIHEYIGDLIQNSEFCKKIYFDFIERLPQDSQSNFVFLDELWCNWMKKGEYNPPHSHFGILSFVIFVQIPFDLEKEYALPAAAMAKNPSNGNFNFIYFNGTKVDALNIGVGKSYEGKMFIFPSTQMHSVNPFYTSDGFRITVSGNVFTKGKLKE